MELGQVIKRPSSTEKSIRLMETQNTLIFIVDYKANKNQIKKAFENMFKAKVSQVKTHITKGEKKAFVTFAKETPAIDIATQLGMI